MVSGQTKNDTISKDKDLKFNYKALIIPSVLIGYGIIGMESHTIQSYNNEIKDELTENIDDKITIDDFSQYSPAASVYVLNAAGIKGWHNFKDRTVILATAYAIMGGTVLTVKSTSRVERPDGSSNNSFPSGHTATAFSLFLFCCFISAKKWIVPLGFIYALLGGYARIYVAQHFPLDVGAGIFTAYFSTLIAWIIHLNYFNKAE